MSEFGTFAYEGTIYAYDTSLILHSVLFFSVSLSFAFQPLPSAHCSRFVISFTSLLFTQSGTIAIKSLYSFLGFR